MCKKIQKNSNGCFGGMNAYHFFSILIFFSFLNQVVAGFIDLIFPEYNVGLAFLVIFNFTLYFALIRMYRISLETFGITKKNLKITFWVSGLFWGLGYKIFQLSLQFIYYGGKYYQTQETIEIFHSYLGNFWVTAYFLIIVVPIVEEIFYRGLIIESLLRKTDWAWFVSAFIFILMHGFTVEYFLATFILTYLYYKKRSVIPTIACHMMFNLLETIYFIVFNGIPSA